VILRAGDRKAECGVSDGIGGIAFIGQDLLWQMTAMESLASRVDPPDKPLVQAVTLSSEFVVGGVDDALTSPARDAAWNECMQRDWKTNL